MTWPSRRSRALRDYALMTLGTAITAVGIDDFYIPTRIADGGVSGLGIILLYLIHIPVWLTLALVNLPLLWLSHKLWGGRVGARTIYGTVMLTVMVGIWPVHIWTHQILLAAVYGGILSGTGLGLVFRARGTTGGSDVIARLVTHILPISMGQAMLTVDFFIIAALAFVFSPTLAMYSLIALFISSRTIDVVQEGTGVSRAFTVVSDQADAIAKRVMAELDRGVTLWEGRGGFTGQRRDLLYIVVNRTEVTRVKEIIYTMDARAFVVVGNVHEVLGEGFRMHELEK